MSPSKRARPNDLAQTVTSLDLATSPATSPATIAAAVTDTIEPVPIPGSIGPPGYLIEHPPNGFQIQGGDAQAVGVFGGGWFELWASPGATRTSGRWFAIGSGATWPGFGMTASADRITINGVPALIRKTADGLDEITTSFAALKAFATPSETSATFTREATYEGVLTVTGFGFTSDEMTSLAGAINIVDRKPTFVGAEALVSGTQQLISRSTPFIDLGGQVYAPGGQDTSYTTADGSGYIRVSTTAQTANDLTVAQLLLPPSPDPRASNLSDRTIEVGSGSHAHPVTVSSDSDGNTVLQWHDAGNTITMSGSLGLDQMLQSAGSVRQATPPEWLDLLVKGRQPPTGQLPDPSVQLPDPSAQPPFTNIGSVTTIDGNRWALSLVSDLTKLLVLYAGKYESSSGAWMSGQRFDFDPAQPLSEYVAIDVTVVVVALRDPAPATSVRITVAGDAPVTIALTKLATSEALGRPDYYAAGYAFSEIAPYTAELLDSSGGVVQQLSRAPQS